MEQIIIRKKNEDNIVLLSNKKIIMFNFKDELNNIFKYLSVFKLSNNYTILNSIDGYDIYLDNLTNLKHYVKNGIEDINMLFKNNGEYCTSLIGDRITSNKKSFRLSNFTLVCSIMAVFIINNILDAYIDHKLATTERYSIEEIDNYNISSLQNIIYASNNLTDEEKDFLYNEDFLTDILPFINSSNYLKYQYKTHFNDIGIKTYDHDDELYENTYGYYSIDNPNILKIKDYKGFDIKYEDTIAHEFIHLCQDTTGYNLIIEASAEIISSEYFNAPLKYYSSQVILLKKLMEIIGSEPIWYYNFTGDFIKIEERVKPYLDEFDYQEFLNCLTFNYEEKCENEVKYQRLNELLGILYQNIYQKDIEDDLIINLIDKDDLSLVRYYFNKRYINQENSYYIDKSMGEYQTVSYEDAMNNDLIHIWAITKLEITFEETQQYTDKEYFNIKREIDYNSNSITITRRTDSRNATYITGIIDDIKYENENLDDLYKQGIINVKYYLTDSKELSYFEYINKEYTKDAEIYILHAKDTIINENDVYGFIKPKVYLDTIDTRYQIDTMKKKLG